MNRAMHDAPPSADGSAESTASGEGQASSGSLPVVHVVDDDAAIRELIVQLLRSAGIAVQAYPSAHAFLDALPQAPAGCLITDIKMPEMDGLELQQELIARGVALPIVVITAHGDIPTAIAALKAGAMDFIEKPFDPVELLAAAREALAAGARRAQAEAAAGDIEQRFNSLTARERDVLEVLIEGGANKEIGRALGMSPRTVEVHRARIMLKMKADSLSELVRLMFVIRR